MKVDLNVILNYIVLLS